MHIHAPSVDEVFVQRVLQGFLHLLLKQPLDWACTEFNGQADTIALACDAFTLEDGTTAFTTVQLFGVYRRPHPLSSHPAQLFGIPILDRPLINVLKAVLLHAGCVMTNNGPSVGDLCVEEKDLSAHDLLGSTGPSVAALLDIGWTPGTDLHTCAQAARRFIKRSPNNRRVVW